MHPVPGHVSLDGISQEVEGFVGRFLGHHVHVGLQHHAGAFLHPFRRRLADQDVAGLIDRGIQAQALAELDKEGSNLVQVTGRPGHLGNGIEVLPDVLGRQRRQRVLQRDPSGYRRARLHRGGRRNCGRRGPRRGTCCVDAALMAEEGPLVALATVWQDAHSLLPARATADLEVTALVQAVDAGRIGDRRRGGGGSREWRGRRRRWRNPSGKAEQTGAQTEQTGEPTSPAGTGSCD